MTSRFNRSMTAGVLAFSLLALSAGPAFAEDSVQRASTASLGASLMTASAAGWIAYAGSELTVKAVEASGEGVVIVLEGASNAVETSVKVSADALQASGAAVGSSVRVVAESTGYALIASGRLLAFVPNEIGRALLHDARY